MMGRLKKTAAGCDRRRRLHHRRGIEHLTGST
jgi:hypothetical protein